MSVNIGEQQNKHLTFPPHDERYFTRIGWLVLGFGIFGFLIWAAFAPLDKGVGSPGFVIVSGNRKIVQAPVNGIINTILVKEGDKVRAGEVLLQLNQVQAQTQIDTLHDQYYTSLASEGRLLAERDGLDHVTFSPELMKREAQPRIAEIIMLQKQLFASRRLSLQSEIEGYGQSMDGVRFQLKGLQDSCRNKRLQLSNLREQMNNMKPLADDGYFPRNRYLDMQRQFADVNSSIDEITGRIGQLNKQLLEVQQRIYLRRADNQNEIRSSLVQTQMATVDFRSKLEMANVELSRTTITSPVDGTVVGLNVFTQGGVVNVGDPLMDVVPSEAPLVVDSRLNVNLIDKVYSGLPVDLMFTAFNQNNTPIVPGVVTLVSADRLLDRITAEPYYQIHVSVAPEGMKMLEDKDIKPGMPVDVFVKTGSRSLLSYLLKPILDRAHTSLSEE